MLGRVCWVFHVQVCCAVWISPGATSLWRENCSPKLCLFHIYITKMQQIVLGRDSIYGLVVDGIGVRYFILSSNTLQFNDEDKFQERSFNKKNHTGM